MADLQAALLGGIIAGTATLAGVVVSQVGGYVLQRGAVRSDAEAASAERTRQALIDCQESLTVLPSVIWSPGFHGLANDPNLTTTGRYVSAVEYGFRLLAIRARLTDPALRQLVLEITDAVLMAAKRAHEAQYPPPEGADTPPEAPTADPLHIATRALLRIDELLQEHS